MTDANPAEDTNDTNDDSAPFPLLRPGDDGFSDAARTLIGQGSPDVVARPRDAAEVARTLHLAKEHDLTLTVRAGGHSMAGLSTARGGLLLDLRDMDSVLADPGTRRVSIGGGARWGQVARALAPLGLALTAGDTAGVGVGGLTLGGGIGWMVRHFGLAVDSLVGAQVVTADGRTLGTSTSRHPDLFWALRGGGGNFGVVTHFDFVAHSVPRVTFGTAVLRIEDEGEEDVSGKLERWSTLQRRADERLTSTFSLLPRMGDSPKSAMLQICFAGEGEDADSAIESFLHLGTVVSDDISGHAYADILVEAGELHGMHVAQRNVLLPRLGGHECTTIAREFARGELMLSLRGLGGAFARVAPEATAFADRSAVAMLVATRMMPAGIDTETGDKVGTGDTVTGTGDSEKGPGTTGSPTPASPDATDLPGWDALSALGNGAYVNFLDSATTTDTLACYPAAALARLQAVKAEYDPDNVFSRAVGVATGDHGVGD